MYDSRADVDYEDDSDDETVRQGLISSQPKPRSSCSCWSALSVVILVAGAFAVGTRAFSLKQSRAQDLHRFGTVFVLRFFILLRHGNAGGQMGDAHRAARGARRFQISNGRIRLCREWR